MKFKDIDKIKVAISEMRFLHKKSLNIPNGLSETVEEGHKTTVNKTLNKIEQHEYHLKQSALETRLSNMSTTGIKYWVCCIKEPCLISNLSIIYFD
jgi:hypothetical protein